MITNKNKIATFLIGKKKAIITLAVIVIVAWILGQLIVPTLLKAIFL